MCHPQWVTCMQEHATKSPILVTYNGWHVCKITPLSLEYMPPTMSDTYARAHHHVSSTCHFISVRYARSRHHVSSMCHFISVMYARARHHVSSTYHSTSDTYAITWHYDSITCHSLNDMYARAWHTRDTYKARQTQAPRLVSLTGSSNPRSLLGKPLLSSTWLSKPRANTSPVQGSINPRFTLGEPFFFC